MPEPPNPAVLVTRPEPGASETAARLTALGFCPLLAPAIRIQPMPPRLPPPDRVVAALITSGQAVGALPASYRNARLFAVGDATAARARQAGFTDVTSAAGDAADLIAAVRGGVAPGSTLLLVTGQRLGFPLATSLRELGFAVIRRSVYAPVPVRRLPPPALRALRAGEVTAALFFSADTATRFAAMAGGNMLENSFGNTDAVAISPAAAVALKGLPWRRILIAACPNQDAMLALLR